jgi:glycosyltransferase involved in cell wall biosynthesis
MELKRRFGIPWVADFRDIWESRPPESLYHDQKLVKKSLNLLAEIGSKADRITAVNDTIGKRISPTAQTISGGYDPDDFIGLSGDAPSDRFLLCYLGTVGALHPIEPFLDAMKRACADNRLLANDLHLTIIGANDKTALMNLARRYNVDDKIEVISYLPHREALRSASKAAVLLLSVPAGHDDMITGKVYDYLALPAPILASAPSDSAAAKFVDANSAGISVSPAQTDELAQAIHRLYDRWRRGDKWQKNALRGLTRRDAAGQFNAIFESILHGKNG